MAYHRVAFNVFLKKKTTKVSPLSLENSYFKRQKSCMQVTKNESLNPLAESQDLAAKNELQRTSSDCKKPYRI